ncbi:DUF6491 family protein [uncultured Brevundimonas sp.]|uniref:DUF6491 family protein n=1 Tax=uncultured Brevundimonas sp. TaxID=213418 RepID=UPI0030EB57E6
MPPLQHRILPTALLAASLTALAACAPVPGSGDTAPRTGRACFYPDQVVNFRQGDAQSVYLRAQGSDVFELRATGYCRDLDSANVLGISSPAGMASRLCAGDFAVVTTSAGISPAGPCRVQVARRLTADEVAALPDRQRP